MKKGFGLLKNHYKQIAPYNNDKKYKSIHLLPNKKTLSNNIYSPLTAFSTIGKGVNLSLYLFFATVKYITTLMFCSVYPFLIVSC